MSLKQLNQIDKPTKYSVYGWIRETETQFKLKHTPSMITAICILYFRDDEIFDINNRNEKKIKLSSNRKSITKIGDIMTNNIGWNNNTYGTIQISSMNNMVYKWDIKIIKAISRCSIIVGITSNNIPDKFIGNSRNPGVYYAFWSHGKKGAHNIPMAICGDDFGTNDQVSIYLDLNNAQIGFYINENLQEIAFRNIVRSKNVTYRLFVSMWNIGESVEIINFSKHWKCELSK